MKISSLGAGVQSSAMFLMSCYGELEKVDAQIDMFINECTGMCGV